MLTFQDERTIFGVDYMRSVLGKNATPHSLIKMIRKSRQARAARLRSFRELKIGNDLIRSLLRERCDRLSSDWLFERACSMANLAKDNADYMYHGGISHLPCGADDAWCEGHIDYPRAMAIQYYLASQELARMGS